MPGKRGTLAERFWPKVDKAGPVHPTLGTPCWLWTGAKTRDGYGYVWSGSRESGHVRAYRAAYEMIVGPIPVGRVIDHLCRVRACVNPAHLEPVTIAENVLRGVGSSAIRASQTKCKRGHAFTEENTIRMKRNGKRKCRTCTNLQQIEGRKRRKAGA